MSNSIDEPETWNKGQSADQLRYVKCNACFGTGEDRHGYGDCIECHGYGDVEARY